MAEIHELKPHRIASESAIEKLEDTLAKARAGEVAAVAICTIRYDGAANSAFSPCDNGVTMLGAIDLLRLRYARELLEQVDE